MASASVGGSPSAAIAAMMRKKLGGGDVDVAAVEAVSRPGSSAKNNMANEGREKKLTHMTKGRAKGPKRRLPTTEPTQADRDEKQSTASKVRFSEPETSSPRSKPIPREKPTPLSTKSNTFSSRSGNLLVSERLAMFSGRVSSNGASFTETVSTSVSKPPDGLRTASSVTFKAPDDKPKPATPAKPAFATIKSGDKVRPVSLIFPPQKSSVYDRTKFADDFARTELYYKQPPAVPQKPNIQSLSRSSYPAAVSKHKEVEVAGLLKATRTIPQTLPNPNSKPASLLQEKPSFPISSITSAALSKPVISKPVLKPIADGPTTNEGISVKEKEKPVLRAKPLSTLRSLFESREKPLSSLSKSGSPMGLHSKPDPPRKPPIFHSRSKSYSDSSNIGKPSVPPKPKPLFARYSSDKVDRLAHNNGGVMVAFDYELPAKAPASKPRPVSVGPSTAPISESLSQQSAGVKMPSEPLEASRRPKPATKSNLYKQEDKLPGADVKSRMSAFSRAPTKDSKPPLSRKPMVAGNSVVREPPILTLLPRPAKQETETVVTSKFSVRDAVSNWGVPSSRSGKGSTTITILPAQTPLVS
ncbi:hypothetical protein POJ06DRAFT_275109 [Lipomyces tetrasporus]|uniref:Uncharacterized protein n=1 Tax=Lipomyces tetrasporus TaxID=54092 RepID=A0AAD7QUT6_9ASCO|nr:uncharacterized protein POJ06DRAFT_275109 [Lipomyces tetrasporus]KAJ8101391.1 hypothetical protein POJ06DRAFT_275109 [Lipomyces tetrasporus]